MSTDGTHACPARTCDKRLPFEVLACKSHWSALPLPLRRAIGRAWRDGELVEYSRLRDEAVAVLNPA